jgi:glyoxylase-like metal-dependent hydrolase (beta-lactamase superfamily II)
MVPIYTSISLFRSGYCTAPGFVVDPQRGKGRQTFYAVWALLRHPTHGIILFDTGYAERFYQATKSWPEKLYALATPVTISKEEEVVQVLERAGIAASEVNYLLVSHFHADHIGGLLDFPEAKIICSRKAYEEVAHIKRWGGVKKGLLKKLIPDDLATRVRFIESISHPVADASSGLIFYDLFGDSSIRLADLPGHARGMLGLLIPGKEQSIFLASDAAWRHDTFLRQVMPSPIAKLFFDDWKAYRQTFHRLLLYHRSNPSVRILFTHCPETIHYLHT